MSTASDEEKERLALCNAKICISVPITINNVKAMYLLVMGDTDDFAGEDKVIEYIKDLHTLMQPVLLS